MSGNPNEDVNSKSPKKNESSEDQNEEIYKSKETASLEKPMTSFTGAISEKNKASVTGTDKATSKNLPTITIKGASPSARLEQPSTSSTGAIPKEGTVIKSSSSNQLEENYEQESDASLLLHPERSRKKLSPINIIKQIRKSPTRISKALFSSKSCDDVKSGTKTRLTTKVVEVSENSESDKEGELTNITKGKKSKKKRNTSGSNEQSGKKSKTSGISLGAGHTSKESSKSESNPTVHDLLNKNFISPENFIAKGSDESSSSAPLTEDSYIYSDASTQFSQLSADSPNVRKLDTTDPKPKTDKDKDSEPETES